MNWTWHNGFIQEMWQNVKDSLTILSLPYVILQLMIFLIKVISVIVCLFLSEIQNYGYLTSREGNLETASFKKRSTCDFIHLLTCRFNLGTYEYVD